MHARCLFRSNSSNAHTASQKRYATEKLWQPLLAGSVPVYWGAPDAKSLLPHPDAAVHVRDFAPSGGGAPDVNALAAHLRVRSPGPCTRELDQNLAL